ncbi:MAG TPA: AsmA-like C-terminal region-containing protein, partial [Geobacteraceae bacterium]|nr:AsmA-like C-terminal region-containing protein [Geobacteraceae bacterium]
PREVCLAYELELTPRDISVKSLDLIVDGLRVTGSCTLGDIRSNDPRITARAATSLFRLEEFRQYIPYGIIVKNVADIIERHIVGGVYKLDDGRLDGRVSQILHMERGDNYNVLSIRGHVEKGLVTLGPNVPPFNNIRGELEMRGKDFLLRRVTGNFGRSPFTLEGKIADYPLDTPASYPFTMAITPAQSEVAWLLRRNVPSEIAFSGRSVLRLAGSGSTADYRLHGSWDLTGADYGYRQLLHKPRGIDNRLRFTARLGKTEAQLADLHYLLSPLDVSATATYRYDEQEPLMFALATNRFMVDPLLQILPVLEKYHPSGTLQARFSGSGDPAETDGVRLKGDMTVDKFSLRPSGQIKPLSDITGTIHVTEASLETEQLTGRVGNSDFAVTGRVAGLAEPATDLVFSFRTLHLEDFGFQAPERIPEVRNLSGNISLKDRNIQIVSLSGEVARSQFSMSGELLDIGAPKITVRADFPYFKAEDLAPLTRLQRAGNNGERTPDITLKATVTAAAGSIRDITFEKLDTALTLNNDLLDVHSLTVGVFGGIVSGNGKADLAADGGPMYQARYRLDRVDATRLLRVTGTEHHLTGRMAGEGEVSFQGNNLEHMKNTTLGHAEIMLTDGALNFPAAGGLSERHEFPFKKAQARLSYAGKVLDVTWVRIE